MLSWDNDLVRMCWRCGVGGIDLSVGGVVLSWDNDLVRMCWRRHLLQCVGGDICYREYGHVGDIDLSVGEWVLSWDNDLVRMCWRRHLLQGI